MREYRYAFIDETGNIALRAELPNFIQMPEGGTITGFRDAPEELLNTQSWYLTEYVYPTTLSHLGKYSEEVTTTLVSNKVICTVQVISKSLIELEKEFETALDLHLDMKAKEKRYTNRITCSTRAGYAGPYQQEGIAFATWMDTCNAFAYQLMAECLSGARPIPTIEEFINELPVFDWSTIGAA